MRALLLGYYGFGNYGDEWVLHEVASATASILPEAEITVISGDPEQTQRLHGLPAVGRDLLTLRSMVNWSDLLICGGGSLLQDSTSYRSLFWYLSVINYVAKQGKQVVLWGQGLGPLERKGSRTLVKRVLDRVDLITLRDAQSAALLGQIGLSGPRVELAADPVFSGADADQPSRKGDLFTIVLREWPGRDREQWVTGLAEILRQKVEELQGEVILCGLQPPDDLPVLRSMQAKLKELGVPAEIMPDWQNLNQVPELFRQSSLILSQRYHGLALAAQERIPAVGLAYDPKMSALGRQLGFPVVSEEELAGPEAWAQATRQARTALTSIEERLNRLDQLAQVSTKAVADMVRAQ